MTENKDVVIKSKKDGKCFEADYSKSNVIMNTGCKDRFTYTKQSTLQHQGTGLCLEPYDWYGSYNKWHKILLKGDCSSHASVFISTSQGAFVHAASGYCLYNSNGYLYIMTCDGTASTKFSIIKGILQSFIHSYPEGKRILL